MLRKQQRKAIGGYWLWI